MNKNLLFLIFSTLTVIFSVVIMSVGPIINKTLNSNNTWGYQNCELISDQVKLLKDDVTKLKAMKGLCYRQKAMHNMEYCSFIINIVLGFVCADLALIHYLGLGKEFEVKTGIIGLISGIIGFVLALVYICYSGYMFTNDVAYMELTIGGNSNQFDFSKSKAIVRLYSNGAKYKWEEREDTSIYPNEGIYVTDYENDRNDFSNYIRYKDLGKKQYNYNSDYYKSYHNYNDKDEDENQCILSRGASSSSSDGDPLIILSETDRKNKVNTDCENLFCKPEEGKNNKDLYDRWLTTLIFSCFVLLCDLGLAFFGFMLCSNLGSNANIKEN